MTVDYMLRDVMVEIERHRLMLADLQDKLSKAISDLEVREDAWTEVYLTDTGSE